MPRILLVDDDKGLCDLLREYLSSEGFTVDAVYSGEGIVDKVSHNRFDAVLLDLMLPEVSGLEVLRQLREIGDPQIPVLMLTARGDDIDRIVGLELGADDYIPKPCNPREIVARLRAVLRRSSASQSHPEDCSIVVGNVVLNPGDRTVVKGDLVLHLTSSEFNVLKVLMTHAGRVVTKAALMEMALGRPLTDYDRSIDVHVSKLRKKLQDPGTELIKTIHSAGYLYSMPKADTNCS